MSTFSTTCHECGAPVVRKRQSKPVAIHFCGMACKAAYQRKAKPVTEQWLRDHYLDRGMNTTEIAHLVGRNPKSVWNWLIDFRIPTRSRGSEGANNFPKDGRSFKGKRHSQETKNRLREIAIADGRVPYDRKVGSYMKGRKGPDTPNWKGGITPDRQAVYSSPEWSNAVKVVWRRDQATCQKCGLRKRDSRDTPFDIHHMVGFQRAGLRTEPSNLILLCEPCHYWVHSRKNVNGEFIRT
jgi:hypothetical protein